MLRYSAYKSQHKKWLEYVTAIVMCICDMADLKLAEKVTQSS